MLGDFLYHEMIIFVSLEWQFLFLAAEGNLTA